MNLKTCLNCGALPCDQTTSANMLGELLAVIHRDGGQRQDEVGVEQAWKEAMLLSAERLPSVDDLAKRYAENVL